MAVRAKLRQQRGCRALVVEFFILLTFWRYFVGGSSLNVMIFRANRVISRLCLPLTIRC